MNWAEHDTSVQGETNAADARHTALQNDVSLTTTVAVFIYLELCSNYVALRSMRYANSILAPKTSISLCADPVLG